MMKPTVLAFAVLVSAGSAQATLLSTLINTGGTVVDGDKTFSNFSCTSTGNSGDSCSVLDVAPLSGTSVGLTYTGGLGAAGAGGNQDTVIGYSVTVTDPTQAIQQVSLAFNGAINGATSPDQAIVAVSETVRSGSTIVGQINVSAPVDLQDPPFEGIFDIPLNGQFTTLNITKDINIKTFATGVSGTISFIDQDFAQTGQQNVVPEPGVLALFGFGLVSLGAILYRRPPRL